MNDFKEGLIGAIVGVVGAIMFASIATSFAQDDKLKDSIWIFTLIGLASTISTIFIFKTAICPCQAEPGKRSSPISY